jgi:uncharacterized membrane protein YbhN (UPF0104 family)
MTTRFPLKRVARWLVSAVAVAFVVWVLPFRDRCTDAGCQDGLLTTLRRTNLPLLVAMFGVYLVGTVAWAARWSSLLRLAGVDLSLGAAWRVTIEAQAGGILLPGGVAGDALRVAYAKERAPTGNLAKITASIMADRVVGLVTLATLALGFALAFDAGKDVRVALPMLAGIPAGAAVGLWVLRRPALQKARFIQGKLGQRVVLPMLEYAVSPGGPAALLRAFLLSLLVSGTQLLVVRGLVATLGAHPGEESWVYVGSAFAMIVGAVPVTPGGWGTSDAAYVFFLGRAGIAPAQAAAVCLLYRLMWYATGSMGAFSAFARTSRDGP